MPGWIRICLSPWATSLAECRWSVRIQYKPLIRFIWLGALIMALGGLIAISDRRYRRKPRLRRLQRRHRHEPFLSGH